MCLSDGKVRQAILWLLLSHDLHVWRHGVGLACEGHTKFDMPVMQISEVQCAVLYINVCYWNLRENCARGTDLKFISMWVVNENHENMLNGKCKGALLKLECLCKLPGDFVKMQILIQNLWVKVQNSECLPSSEIMAKLLIHESHLENQRGRWLKLEGQYWTLVKEKSCKEIVESSQ